jgi:monovalent cation:H+ antiporter-2, CPA2 family
MRAGMILVAHGEFSIIIAGLGTSLEPRLGPLAAAYVLLMAILGPITARWLPGQKNQSTQNLVGGN